MYSGLINFLAITAANEHVLMRAADLSHGEVDVFHGNSCYTGIVISSEINSAKTEKTVAVRPGNRPVLAHTPEVKLKDLIETAKFHIRL